MLAPTNYEVDKLAHCFNTLSAGPLDEYRKKASFDWRKMKLTLEGEDVVKFKHLIWSKLENDPLFFRKPSEELSRKNLRQITHQRLKKLLDYNFVSEEECLTNPYLVAGFIQAIGQFSWSLIVKRVLSVEYFILSTKIGYSQSEDLLKKISNFNALGCISITEMAHGSDTKKLQTTATFDPKTQEFILNTPNLEATKVWSGVLGESATHAIVFAQLYTPDKICHGLHSFMVPVRNPSTLLSYKNVLIGDMGGKIGLNGIDNGFMIFNNYRIPKSALMGHSANVTEDGNYVSLVKDKSKRLGVTLGVLSTGRIFITLISLTNLQTALCIAIRYSAVRKQFGSSNSEWPILEYQSQQWRLFPYLAASFVLHNFFGSLYRDYVDFIWQAIMASSIEEQLKVGAEIHSLSSCAKALSSWITRDAIQECRECCGGHGYLQASRFGELRNDHDANTTYEGDNHVLLQQTSNYLMKLFEEKLTSNKPISSPFKTVNYINDIEKILQTQMKPDVNNIYNVIEAFNFLVCYLLKESHLKLNQELIKLNNDQFFARSQCQIYYLRSLAIAFAENEIITRFVGFCEDPQLPTEIRNVLKKLGLLYALWSLEKYEAILYESNFFLKSMKPTSEIQKVILKLCYELKNESVALVDSFAPPDFILNSCLGQENGKIYENIFNSLIHNKQAFERPDWFCELIEKKIVDSILSTYSSKL